MDLLSDLGSAFFLGLLTPLGAVCVLPLYPGFLAYLANQVSGEQAGRWTFFLLGLVITAGVIIFMVALGIIFTTILETSLTNVIGIVSPIAFGILFVISILLILDFDIGRFLPKARTRLGKHPWRNAFTYGFFFGAIVVPCNPLFIAALFTTTVTAVDFVKNVLQFLFFGVGIGFPLVVIAAISTAGTKTIIGFITRFKRIINLIAGLVMLGISVYYLVFIFRVFERIF